MFSLIVLMEVEHEVVELRQPKYRECKFNLIFQV